MTAEVDAPAGELFDLLANPSTEERWNPDVIEVRRLDSGAVAPGSRWEGRYKGMGIMRIELTEMEPQQRLAFDIDGDRLGMRFAFDFTPVGDRTRLESVADVEARGWMR